MEDLRARLNFRPALFCAFGLSCGLLLYGKIFFGEIKPYDFLFPAVFLLLALPPLKRGRVFAIFLTVVLFFGAGMLSLHLFTLRFSSAAAAGEYRLMGTVVSISHKRGYSVVTLDDLFLDGEPQGGKCRVTFGEEEEIALSDILVCDASLSPVNARDAERDRYARYCFSEDIRFLASVSGAERAGRSKDPFLKVSAALYDILHKNMGEEQADLAYALLTGNSGDLDEGLSETVRQGGIAHIFAISGLHIGILYSAVYLCARPLKRLRFLPALAAAALYCAFCGFTVSSVRAVLMCAVLGTTRSLGRKYDFPGSVALAAVATLLFFPAQWYSVGMRLSYGACLGLALFAGSFGRLFARLRFPRFLGGYLSASLAVQIFVFPILFDAFGYVPALSVVWNLFLVPLLPALFLCTFVCALLSLVIPPAASFFLLFPAGGFTALLYLLSAAEAPLTIAGFALGAGGAVWLTGCLMLSPRVRLRPLLRGCAFTGLALLFALSLTLENVVFYGCRIDCYAREDAYAALVRTSSERVLVTGGDISLEECREFLRRTYGGGLTAVIVLAEDEVAGANTAAFLPAERVCLKDECETGLARRIDFGERVEAGGLLFCYETRTKLVLYAEGASVEIDFTGVSALGADLFVGSASSGLKYFLRNGIIKTL